MPAAPLFDVESLTRPIPGTDPAGVPLGLREKNLLKEYREEHDPSTLSAEDLKDYALANKPRKVAASVTSNASRKSLPRFAR